MPEKGVRQIRPISESKAMLTHRKLTSEEAALLHAELKTTPNILGYTIRELLRCSDVWVAEEDGAFAGACISKDLRFGWTDIAVLYVVPAFRGRGLGRELYDVAWKRAEQRGRHILTLSRNLEVIVMMKRRGMRVSGSMWKAPFAMHLHMQCHMMSVYRLREGLRKGRQMQTESPLLVGIRKHASG